MKSSRTRTSIHLAVRLFRAQSLILIPLFLFSALFTINMEDFVRTLGPADDKLRMGLLIGSGLWELIEGALFFIILSLGIVKITPLKNKTLLREPFKEPFLGAFAAEYLRMLAQVLAWAILLLIPGFVRYAQLIFVPYITLFSSAYANDEVDALKFSHELTKKRFKLVFTVFLFATLAQVLVEFAPHLMTSLYTAPMRAAFLLLSFLISIWTYSFMFGLFQETLEA